MCVLHSQILLQRNDLYDNTAAKYLAQVTDKRSSCKINEQPKPSRKVPLSSLSRTFNSKVCVDHLHLGDDIVFHAVDARTRYSVGCVVENTTVERTIEAFESQWVSEFWYPDTVIGDPAFNNAPFKSYLTQHVISLRPTPPRLHSKNVLKSNHRILRDIFLRLKHANEKMDTPILC